MEDPDSVLSSGVGRRHLILLLPFLWQVGGVPWANVVAWRPFGMPFLLAWEMIGVLVASLAIGLVYKLDRRTKAVAR